MSSAYQPISAHNNNNTRMNELLNRIGTEKTLCVFFSRVLFHIVK